MSKSKSTAALKSSKELARTRKHLFGLLTTVALLIVGPLLGVLLLYLASFLTVLLLLFLCSVLAVVVFVLCRVYAKVYFDNVLIITDINVQQVTRKTLFSGKRSVLGLANIEDVTIIRKCVFCYLLDYGTLNIETAGEQDNFLFPYCPQPNKYVKILMQAREKYIQANPGQVAR